MMNDREVVFVSAARTPIGEFGGALKDLRLGHPAGMTGLRIVITLIYEMRRRGLKRGLANLCGGGGQGMAVIVERD